MNAECNDIWRTAGESGRSRPRRALGAVLAAIMIIAVSVTAAPAAAAGPIRESDTTEAVTFRAIHGDRQLDVNLMRSAAIGTFADVALYEGPEGSSIGTGSGTSEWTDRTFAASIQLSGDDGDDLGTAEISGSYAAVGDPQRNAQKFNDGNVRIATTDTVTVLQISDLEVSVDGVSYEPAEISGDHRTQTLFVTQPATYTNHASQLALGNAATENLDDFYTDLAHGIESVYLYAEYANSPLHASQQVDLSTGHWDGSFDLREEDGEAIGTVDAMIRLTDRGRTERFFERTRGGYAGYSVTPYTFSMIIDGPNGPASVTAEAAVLRYGVHTSPLEDFAG